MQAAKSQHIDIVISDMTRGQEAEAGLDLLRGLQEHSLALPVIIFSAPFAAERPQDALNAGAFGCTREVTELYRLVRATAELVKSGLAGVADGWFVRVQSVVGPLGIPWDSSLQWLREGTAGAAKLARQLLVLTPDADRCYENHLRVVQACAASIVNQVIVLADGRLVVAASIHGPRTTMGYRIADWGGLIGRCAKQGVPVWVEDVSKAAGYLAAEPITRSELVIPISNGREAEAMAVVNVEIARTHALTPTQIEWLKAFVAPLSSRVPSKRPITWLSYAKDDAAFAARLLDDLTRRKCRVQSLRSVDELNVSDAVLLLASASSMTVKHRYLPLALGELNAFRSIVPVFIEGATLSDPVVCDWKDSVDLRGDYEQGVGQLVSILSPQGGLARRGHYPEVPKTHARQQTIQMEIVYATDRQEVESKDGVIRYGGARAPGLSFGVGWVNVPLMHRIGKLERPSALRLQFRVNHAKHFDLLKTERVSEHQLIDGLLPAMGNVSRSTLIYIPGHNVDFEHGMLRAAQISYDLQLQASLVLYSWPSQGKVSAYIAN
jgi:putative methionine-R-sulfoxide reductase with GAF domain